MRLLPCRPRDDITDAKERAAAEEAANKEAQKAAMRVTADSSKVGCCTLLWFMFVSR